MTARTLREEVAEHAAEAFKTHIAAPGANGWWRCERRDGSNLYGFFLITGPGVLVVTGDIGDVVLRVSDSDAEAWARRCDSLDYFASKVEASPRGQRPREFCQAKFDQAAAEAEADAKAEGGKPLPEEVVEAIASIRDGGANDPAGMWAEAWWLATGDFERRDEVEDHARCVLWAWAAVQWWRAATGNMKVQP